MSQDDSKTEKVEIGFEVPFALNDREIDMLVQLFSNAVILAAPKQDDIREVLSVATKIKKIP